MRAAMRERALQPGSPPRQSCIHALSHTRPHKQRMPQDMPLHTRRSRLAGQFLRTASQALQLRAPLHGPRLRRRTARAAALAPGHQGRVGYPRQGTVAQVDHQVAHTAHQKGSWWLWVWLCLWPTPHRHGLHRALSKKLLGRGGGWHRCQHTPDVCRRPSFPTAGHGHHACTSRTQPTQEGRRRHTYYWALSAVLNRHTGPAARCLKANPHCLCRQSNLAQNVPEYPTIHYAHRLNLRPCLTTRLPSLVSVLPEHACTSPARPWYGLTLVPTLYHQSP